MTDSQILALTPKFPENFSEILQDLFLWNEYMFTWRNERNEKIGYCTHCQTEMCLELGRTYSSQDLEAYQNKHNQKGLCPKCKTTVTWKDRNRGRKKLFEENYLFYFQPLSNGGIILRSMFCRKTFQTDIKSKVEWDEQHRIFFFDGQAYKYRRRPDYWYGYGINDWYSGTDEGFYWDEIKKLSTPTPFQSKMYGAFWGDIKYAIDNTIFEKGQYKYSCLKEWLQPEQYSKEFWKVVEYLTLFTRNPSLVEKLMKQGFRNILLEKFTSDTRGIINWNKKTVSEAFKLNKGEVRLLIGDSVTEIFITQCKHIYGITNDNIVKLNGMCKYDYERSVFTRIFKDKAIKNNKIVKYLSKNKITCYEYNDYLNQMNELNIPKTDSSLYPKNFSEAHNQLSVELTRIANEKERALALEQQKLFKKRYKKLLKSLYFADEQFLIRPAKGDEELLAESTALGHCVYKNYKDRYKTGKTIICVVRKRNEPHTPYYTLEINPDFVRIIQCRGLKNCGMTDEVENFTNLWFEHIHSAKFNKKENKEKCQTTAA